MATGTLIAGLLSAVLSTGLTAASAAGAFDKNTNPDLTLEERQERARRAAAAAKGGRQGTILTGGSLSQRDQGAGAASRAGTALLGG